MFLTRSNVLYYLVQKQFADVEAAVAGPFVVRSLSRRNLNFHVTFGRTEYLVKQSRSWDLQGRTSIEREAAFYSHRKNAECLSSLAPACYAYDPQNSILIIEFLSRFVELGRAPDRFSPELGRLCGETMAGFHNALQGSKCASEFPASVPSHLSLDKIPKDLQAHSAAQHQLLHVLKKYPEFARELGRIRAEWQPDTLIHRDWKIENCMLSPDRSTLRMIDWEFASRGDSSWDVSTLLQSYWNFWVRQPSRYPIQTIRPVLQAFLNAYSQARPLDLARAIRFAAARMLQTAFETLDKAERMTAPAVLLLQGSLNIFKQPEWTAEELLGWELPGSAQRLRKVSASV